MSPFPPEIQDALGVLKKVETAKYLEKDATMDADARVTTLTSKHAELDRTIEEERQRPLPDSLLITRLKREKLRIKDEIHLLQQNNGVAH